MDMLNQSQVPFLGITSINVFHAKSLSYNQIDNRCFHGILFKLHGTIEYTCGNKTVPFSAGEVVFVRQGASYSYRALTESDSYVVSFECSSCPDVPIMKMPLPPNFDVIPMAEKLYRHWQNGQVYGALNCFYAILEKVNIAHDAENQKLELLEPVMAYLKEHITDPNLTLSVLPKLAGVSDSYLRRTFKKLYGIAPTGYVIRERIRLASQLLLNQEELPISEVAAKVGYTDQLYFSRLFKQQTGLSPANYRKTYITTIF